MDYKKREWMKGVLIRTHDRLQEKIQRGAAEHNGDLEAAGIIWLCIQILDELADAQVYTDTLMEKLLCMVQRYGILDAFSDPDSEITVDKSFLSA